mmetsp:Transcript_26271/g.76777  ORF Transcript_26271/g.76777 Transcript_26271/m.76777 type:complete len:236 (+) Transcript_26271:477-1184(+)
MVGGARVVARTGVQPEEEVHGVEEAVKAHSARAHRLNACYRHIVTDGALNEHCPPPAGSRGRTPQSVPTPKRRDRDPPRSGTRDRLHHDTRMSCSPFSPYSVPAPCMPRCSRCSSHRRSMCTRSSSSSPRGRGDMQLGMPPTMPRAPRSMECSHAGTDPHHEAATSPEHRQRCSRRIRSHCTQRAERKSGPRDLRRRSRTAAEPRCSPSRPNDRNTRRHHCRHAASARTRSRPHT